MSYILSGITYRDYKFLNLWRFKGTEHLYPVKKLQPPNIDSYTSKPYVMLFIIKFLNNIAIVNLVS